MKWPAVAVCIIAAGIGSRLLHTGLFLIDKYAGDALYAALSYALLRMSGLANRTAMALAFAPMTAFELFQLTGIPLRMANSDSFLSRVLSKLLGTEFSYADLACYAVGIAAIAWATERKM